uniref:Uncharacterized protein n=1 Tax=Heterorhabditis bacteriophora TaxID=37862 RepID=A0A1I7WXV0_HETBA
MDSITRHAHYTIFLYLIYHLKIRLKNKNNLGF